MYRIIPAGCAVIPCKIVDKLDQTSSIDSMGIDIVQIGIYIASGSTFVAQVASFMNLHCLGSAATHIHRQALKWHYLCNLADMSTTQDEGPHLAPFLHADLSVFHKIIPLASDAVTFLDRCRNNVLAEFACLLREGSNGVEHLDGASVTTVRNPHAERGVNASTWTVIPPRTDEHAPYGGVPPIRKLQRERGGSTWVASQEEEPVAPEDLHHHALVWERRLQVAVFDKRSGLTRLIPGAFLDGDNWQHVPGHLLDLGYIGDAIHELEACDRLRVAPPAILTAIASPKNRTRAHFVSGDIEPSVPINARQREVLQGLRHNVEGICGPPGTVRTTHQPRRRASSRILFWWYYASLAAGVMLGSLMRPHFSLNARENRL